MFSVVSFTIWVYLGKLQSLPLVRLNSQHFLFCGSILFPYIANKLQGDLKSPLTLLYELGILFLYLQETEQQKGSYQKCLMG